MKKKMIVMKSYLNILKECEEDDSDEELPEHIKRMYA